LSSDTARTIIVTDVTTADGAELGPVQVHDAAIQPKGGRCQGGWRIRAKPGIELEPGFA
jgi:hypothetical protein